MLDFAATHSSADETRTTQCDPVVLGSFPEPQMEQCWRSLLQRVPLPSHYTLPEFFLEPYFDGKQPFAVLAASGTAVHAVITGFREGNAASCGLPTRPQVQLGPAATSETVEALRRGLEQVAANSTVIKIYSWETGLLDGLMAKGYQRREAGNIPMLDLSLGPEVLLKNCDKKRRNSIRYAMKSGLEVSEASSAEDYAAFYDIYEQWCAAKKMTPYSRAMEDRAFRDAAANRKLFVARYEGKVIAGSVFRFAPGGLVDYSRNSSLPEYQHLKPNDLLVWRSVEWACAAGFQRMSLGGSHRFLREFGGEMAPVYRYQLDKTWLRRHERREQLVEAGGALMRRLPVRWQQAVRKLLGKEIQPGW